MTVWYESNLILIQSTFIFLMLALSIQIPVRWGVLTFGGLGCFGVGAYTAAILTIRTGLPQFLILILAVLAGALVSLLIGLVCARLDGMYLAMATLAFDLIVGVVAINGGSLTGGVDGLYGVVADVSTATLATLAGIGLATAVYLQRGRLGRATTAVRDDPELGVSLGINVRRYRHMAFTISGALAACAGVMYVRVNTTITPDNIQFGALVVAMTMVIVGGWKSSLGTLVGVIIFTWLPPHLGMFQTWQAVIYSALVLVAAVLVPTGAAGVARAAASMIRDRRRRTGGTAAVAAGAVPEAPAAPRPAAEIQRSLPDGGPVVEVQSLSVHFGGVKAVDDVSFTVQRGELFGILGPNGSGKSTLLAALTRFVDPVKGRIVFYGEDCTGIAQYALGRRGIARTFQTVRLLEDLRVVENVLLGNDRTGRGERSQPSARQKATRWHDALAALARVGLQGTELHYPSELSYGQQRRVEIARAIVGTPDVLLLDEPVAGMNREERIEIAALLRSLKDDGLTLILVEHDVEMMVSICDRLLAMNFGQEIAHGAPADVLAHPAVREAYLGRRAAVDA
ncbi:branched-chain amino acid ABC transporter ATP-binding protein/permease [Dactylosporangium fulvum]